MVESNYDRGNELPMPLGLRGGQLQTSEYLLGRGADPNWIGYDQRNHLQAAQENGAKYLIKWLRNQSARLTHELD
jgi:hypothetical protein